MFASVTNNQTIYYGGTVMIKRIITAALACLTAAMLAITCFAESMEIVKKEITAPQKIVFLGDSIAAGYGLDGYTGDGSEPAGSYASLLKTKYTQELSGICSINVFNCAVSGDTSEQLLQKLNNKLFDSNLFGSDVVVISIGGNDLMSPMREFFAKEFGLQTSDDFSKFDKSKLQDITLLTKLPALLDTVTKLLEAFKKNLTDCVDYIHSKTQATVIVQTVYNPLDSMEDAKSISDAVGSKLGELNEIIKSKAKKDDGSLNYEICDVAAEFAGKSNEYTNIAKYDIHPNAEGHKVISELLDKIIKQKKYSFEELVEQKSDADKNKMSTTRIYVTIALFFGGFTALFVFVWIKFKRSQK